MDNWWITGEHKIPIKKSLLEPLFHADLYKQARSTVVQKKTFVLLILKKIHQLSTSYPPCCLALKQ